MTFRSDGICANSVSEFSVAKIPLPNDYQRRRRSSNVRYAFNSVPWFLRGSIRPTVSR